MRGARVRRSERRVVQADPRQNHADTKQNHVKPQREHADTKQNRADPQQPHADPKRNHSEEKARTPIIRARNLMAAGPMGTIFGPVDLDLYPGDLCLVNGVEGSGKSAFLMTLASRFRGVTGSLEINGLDALADPYGTMQDTAVARLGNYVAPEDRLTVEESISERAYLDGIPLAQAERRACAIEELLGYRVERGVEMESLDPVARAVISVALVMLRPASVIVIDDVDLRVPYTHQPLMYELLAKLTQLDGSAIVASAIDGGSVPKGTVRVRLASRRSTYVHSAVDDAVAAVAVVEDDPQSVDDPILSEDPDEVVVGRVGEDGSMVSDPGLLGESAKRSPDGTTTEFVPAGLGASGPVEKDGRPAKPDSKHTTSSSKHAVTAASGSENEKATGSEDKETEGEEAK